MTLLVSELGSSSINSDWLKSLRYLSCIDRGSRSLFFLFWLCLLFLLPLVKGVFPTEGEGKTKQKIS